MIRERIGQSETKMVQGQLPQETELSIIRQDSQLLDTATYVLAGGLKFIATKYGVSFAGASTAFNASQIKRVRTYINRASKIAEELRAGRGLVSEDELDQKLRLRGRKTPEGRHDAWFEGHFAKRVTADNAAMAVCQLRLNWITIHGATS